MTQLKVKWKGDIFPDNTRTWLDADIKFARDVQKKMHPIPNPLFYT